MRLDPSIKSDHIESGPLAPCTNWWRMLSRCLEQTGDQLGLETLL